MGIRISQVSKSFGSFLAIDDVSLDVETGSLVALLGPSGCGKSTLLRIIAGLDVPTSGRVWINGEDATTNSVQERNVGFVFQHFALFKHRTVRENIGFGLELRKWPKEKIRWRVEELLNLVQLQGYGNRYPSQLSGGQRQRVSLARALAVQPKVLLLDEPFSALDAKVRKELRVWLRTLHEETKVTTVIVTHDQEEAFEVADKIVVINQGHIEQIGSAAEIYDHPATPFVLNFVGEVNRLPSFSSSNGAQEAFVRPHDIELLDAAAADSLPGILKRVTHLGRDLYAELQLENGDKIIAQLSRDTDEYNRLTVGDHLHLRPKKVRAY
jgi:sulfate transport system ATP-binding protein